MSETTKSFFQSLLSPRVWDERLGSFFITALFQLMALLALVTLIVLLLADRITFLWVPFALSLFYLGSGLWLLRLRWLEQTSHIFSIFTASTALALACLITSLSGITPYRVLSFLVALTAATLLHFGFIFPEKARFLHHRSWLVYFPYGLAFLLWAGAITASRSPADQPLFYISLVFLSLSVLVFILLIILNRLYIKTPVARQQTTVVLWGCAVAFAPVVLWFLLNLLASSFTQISTILLLSLLILPLSIVYAISRYRRINTDYLLRQAVLYAFLSVLAASGYALLVSGLSLMFGEAIPANNPFTLGFMIFLLALLLNPLRNSFQIQIDRIFFRGQRVYQELLQEFNQSINPSLGMVDLSQLVRDFLERSFLPSQFHLFVLDSFRDRYIATQDETLRPSTDIQFSIDSALPQVLSREGPYLYLKDRSKLPETLLSEKSRINILSSEILIPLHGRSQQINGFLSLAPKRNGEPYTTMDLNLLTSLGDQVAMAVERTQVVSDLERRVNELNVLTRVAQGINITLRFDDILELIYAQANRIVPCKDFFILLYNRENDFYYYAFYLLDDRRLLQRENKPVAPDIDLAFQVIKTGTRIVTENYPSACQEYGIDPQVTGLKSWLGLPLNAGAETIGALSLGNRKPSVAYTQDQIDLLQAIADQAIGAIVKAQLLEESERSARQLNLLNEISRSLTSTLDLPVLLNQILDNAIEIISCEAGTLFLLDEDTGELVFEVVKGPVAADLQGKRLPPGDGHVGRAVESGQASIVNQVRSTEGWDQEPDQQTGFQTRDLLIVPLFVQDRVVGVIELINRQDTLPFTQEDQDLLTAFASQAAIALENARLYTLTDQQLADRVDELSVMQRIDRELNASLDVSRAMRITLDWAIRRSGAEAGLVGSVTPQGIQIMADRGYTNELDQYRQSFLAIELPGIEKAIDNEQTQIIFRSQFEQLKEAAFALLADAQCQLTIPIRREDRVIGVLLLESLRETPWSLETQEFLSRLTDHAAIAIANAELFSQVQEANIAKSEFISFVSHELKTPMTSIRGYTDLLLGKAVGDINQAQKNFLTTIRTNVTRMATLVSDLADISRIEANRFHMEFAPLSMEEAINEVIRSQSYFLEEKDQHLQIEIPDTLSSAWGDHTRIVQILTNLISNANKYTPPGGEITITAEEVENTWDPMGAPIVILVSVKDNGIGMSDEDQAQIFTKFFRSADPKAREVPGTGLGLNITRYLVEMQGGLIWFESELQVGSTFHFTVPTAQV